MKNIAALSFFAALLLVSPLAIAQDKPTDKPAAEQHHAPPGGVLRLLPADSTTEHSITTRSGEKLDYTATAGTLDLFGQDGQSLAKVFYTSYVRKGGDTARRPLTFVFNGGPGAASAFLHLGVAGPKIASFGPNGRDGANAALVDNPDTWVAFTDLVFV